PYPIAEVESFQEGNFRPKLVPFQSRRFTRHWEVGAQSDSGRIFQAEHLAVGVIGEGLAIAGPTDHGPQALLGGFCRHVVFELVEKPARLWLARSSRTRRTCVANGT